MSWMDGLTDEQRAEMNDIGAGISHVRVNSSGTKVLRDGEWVEPGGSAVRSHSMFPFPSVQMAVDPSEVPIVAEYLRKRGMPGVEFDRAGCPIITSTIQQDTLAKALGMKTGRDGYGHVDEAGQFQNSGRRRNDEVQAGRAKVRKAIDTLEAMPENAAPGAVVDVLNQYDIVPTAENTG